MSMILFKNNATGTLAMAVAAADTLLPLSTGHGARFPTPAAGEFFVLTLQGGGNVEIVHVTARALDTLTVERAQEGTLARDWDAGTIAECRLTQGVMEWLRDAITQESTDRAAADAALVPKAGGVALTQALSGPTPVAASHYATKGYVDAKLGNAMVTDLVIGKSSPHVMLQKAASGEASILWGGLGGAARWALYLGDYTPEGGGNTGSHFQLGRFSDAGAYLDSPLSINRVTGITTFTTTPKVGDYTVYHTGNLAPAALGVFNVFGQPQRIACYDPYLSLYFDGVVEWRLWAQADGALRFTTGDGTLARFSFTTAGVLTASNVALASDARLKRDIAPLDDGLALVERLRGVRYTRIETGAREVGVIAQEVRAVLPELVLPGPDDTLAVNYPQLTAVLIEAVKTLSARVAALEAADG